MRWRALSAMAAALVAVLVCSIPVQARHAPNEAKLLARIQRQRNPVKKAKLEVRLANVKLKQAIAAYDARRVSEGAGLLKDYLGVVKDAWHTLQATGRDPTKKPQGFMELEISLRENMRDLSDARGRVYYAERGPINQIQSEIGSLHSQILAALFPSLNAKAPHPKHANSLTGGPGQVHP